MPKKFFLDLPQVGSVFRLNKKNIPAILRLQIHQSNFDRNLAIREPLLKGKTHYNEALSPTK
jgi:hypothetical protein